MLLWIYVTNLTLIWAEVIPTSNRHRITHKLVCHSWPNSTATRQKQRLPNPAPCHLISSIMIANFDCLQGIVILMHLIVPLCMITWSTDYPGVILWFNPVNVFVWFYSFILWMHFALCLVLLDVCLSSKLMRRLMKFFQSNLLTLNCDKTYFLQFLTKTDNEINMQVSFGNRKIATAQSLKFLELTIDTTLTSIILVN